MGAEFRDMHLYLTYLRIAFLTFKVQYPREYQLAVEATGTDIEFGCGADIDEYNEGEGDSEDEKACDSEDDNTGVDDSECEYDWEGIRSSYVSYLAYIWLSKYRNSYTLENYK